MKIMLIVLLILIASYFKLLRVKYNDKVFLVHKHHAMKSYGGVELNLNALLTSALDGEW
jgi:hypothetical protein